MAKNDFRSRTYIGIDLTGAKNHKSNLAALDYYPKEQKVFLVDLFSGLGPEKERSGDQVLLETINEYGKQLAAMGINVPLTLPPCIECTKKTCPLPEKCKVPSVKWMREITKSATKRKKEENFPQIKEFTPYTQRPIELWARYELISNLDPSYRFEIDEALGGNKGPLTARAHFLLRHLKKKKVMETWPKLSVAILGAEFGIPSNVMKSYRSLDQGVRSRAQIVETISDRCEIFIYERDAKKLAQNLSAFDAFICAYTALLSDTGHCAKLPKGFPSSSGWVQHPLWSNLPFEGF